MQAAHSRSILPKNRPGGGSGQKQYIKDAAYPKVGGGRGSAAFFCCVGFCVVFSVLTLAVFSVLLPYNHYR